MVQQLSNLSSLKGLSRVGKMLWETYGTQQKLDNALALQAEMEAGAVTVSHLPWRVVLEPHSGCNLRCPKCLAHEGKLSRGALNPDDVDAYLDGLSDSLVQVNVFHWGEPFLNKRLDQIISKVHAKNIGTTVHANINYVPPGMHEKMMDSGLDLLICSIDGITQETYHQYRVQGEISDVLGNLRAFVDAKRKNGGIGPKIIWKFLYFPHAQHEFEQARKIAQDIGVDEFSAAPAYVGDMMYTTSGAVPLASRNQSEDGVGNFPACHYLYDFPVIHIDGSVLPCCIVAEEKFIFGHRSAAQWLDVMNGPKYQAARRMGRGERDIDSPCDGCYMMKAVGFGSSATQPDSNLARRAENGKVKLKVVA
jgi:MoaA/NifB/PqqE/SkfB family radical SAM enzyme